MVCAGTFCGKAVEDQCGVCGGDNGSCVDCKGVANGDNVLDACGVCEGDGKSCLKCRDTNISEVQTILDGHAVAQRHWILFALKKLRGPGKSRKQKKFSTVVKIKN